MRSEDIDFRQKEKKLARIVGFDYCEVAKIEASLSELHLGPPEEYYLNQLNEQAINTSLSDFYNILKAISKMHPGQMVSICDIGSSYCKMALVAHNFFPNIRVISVEPVTQRIEVTSKKISDSHHIFINDCFSDHLKKEYTIDYYFLYFPVGKTLDRILDNIHSPIIAIESHGELINRLGHSFKEKEVLTKLVQQRHNQYSYLFSKKEVSTDLEKQKNLLKSNEDILEIESSWYADLRDAEFYYDVPEEITVELKTPPRTTTLSKITNSLSTSGLSQQIAKLILLRRSGELIDGYKIRKIFIDGSFELSSGAIRKAP